jgi:phage gpG-like protein
MARVTSKSGNIDDEMNKRIQKMRTKVKAIKPKLTYQFASKVEAIFISKDFSLQVKKGLQAGDKIIITELTNELNKNMESPMWGWTAKVTERKNGEFVRRPRNIVDTGTLRSSLRLRADDGEVNIAYREPYSLITHYGGYIQPYGNPYAKPVYLPARPWVTYTLENYNIGTVYRKAILAQFR